MTVQDVLAVEPRGRLPWGPLVTGGVLLLALIGIAVVLPEGPPAPLAVDVLELDGSALRGEAFVRLNLVPPCPLPDGALVGATLDLTVVDLAGRTRQVRAPLPDGGPLERLGRYRCRT